MSTVLVVDDDPQIRRITALLLRGVGWSTLEAAGPDEAALLYRAADVVLSDWECGAGGGARVLRESRRPCVVHTGSDVDGVGAPIVRKPARIEEIDEALRAALDAHRDFTRHIVTDLDRAEGRAAAARYLANLGGKHV